MTETTASTSSSPQPDSIAMSDRSPADRSLVARYRVDHSNPVNHFLHVGVGWPMMAVAVLLLPFRPVWSLALFLSAYAIMFFGHFVFERNIPTIFEKPSTPFVIAYAVICELWGHIVRLAKPRNSFIETRSAVPANIPPESMGMGRVRAGS